MAYARTTASHDSWFQEQQSMINSASDTELRGLCDKFDENFETTIGTISRAYDGVNVMRDAKRMMESPEIMQEYKTLLLDPILDELRSYPTTSQTEKVHLESVADQLENAWDESRKSFLIQESYNTL